MASVSSRSYGGRYFKFTVTQSGTTTTVNWKFEVLGGSATYYATSKVTLVVNGTTVKTYAAKAWSTQEFPTKKGSVSGSLDIGSYKKITFSMTGNPWWSSGTKKSGELTLTKPSYTVTYYGNAPSGETVSGVPSSQTKEYNVTLTLRTGKPTCTGGWTFAGWNNGSSASSDVEYNPGSNFTNNANGKMYAIWKKTLTLSYDANGGSGAPAASSATVYGYSPSKAFTVSSTQPTSMDEQFLGWSTSKSATASSYAGGASITISKNTTLYAVWKETDTVRVSYDANGGWGVPDSQVKTKSETITLRSGTPKRDYYTFLRWNTAENGSGTNYNPGASYSGGKVTLYAQWQFLTTTVKYHLNGGSGSVPNDRVFSGPGYTNAGWSTNLEDYIRPTPPKGKTFKGWSTVATQGLNGNFYEEMDRVYSLLAGGTINLYAVYVDNNLQITQDVAIKTQQFNEIDGDIILLDNDYVLYGAEFIEGDLTAARLSLGSQSTIVSDILIEY